MRNVRTKVYKFNELNETAKQTAIHNFSSINVDFEWWDGVYMDAENVGLKITSFDLDRNRQAKGDFILSPLECSAKICQEHGKECETYKTAENFSFAYDKLVEKYSDGIDLYRVSYENEYEFDQEANELENEFLQSILEDYSIILEKESDYLQSEQAIIETIEANDYEFLKDGSTY
jgi:hypothetical protein